MLEHDDVEADNPFGPDTFPELPDLSALPADPEDPDTAANKERIRLVGNAKAALQAPFPFVDDENETPAEDASCQWVACDPEWSGPVLKIIDGNATEAAYKKRQNGPHGQNLPFNNDERRAGHIVTVLRSRGEYRKLQPIHGYWREMLDELEASFPNFAEVVDYLRAMYALAEKADGVPRLTPMLLNGEPGSGKSYFAEQFAKAYGSGYLVTHMETAQNNAGLSGSAEYWNNTKPGEVFNLLVDGDFANPVICIDEIEKAISGDYDPLSSLYGLLEPGTSRAFRDLSYPWLPPLDASRIIWIATANDADLLTAPILDRCRRFEIDRPSEQQARDLVKRIYRELMAEQPATVAGMVLTNPAVDALAEYSPRRVKQLLGEALGRSILAGRRRILARDIPASQEMPVINVRPIGFL